MTKARTMTLHLFCDAHLDPAWLWEWEDGVAEAITTFRTAAELCEEFPEFIFNHNESLLYELVLEHAPVDGRERLAQQWVAAVSRRVDRALTCVNNGTYGFDCTESELRLSLLRSPAFSGHDGIKQDRFAPRIDQGERRFRFWFNGGRVRERLAAIGAEAQALNEAPYALSYFPPGKGRKARPAVLLSNPAVQLTALKTAQDGKSLLLRLFESTGRKRTVRLSLPVFRRAFSLSLGGFEIKSLVFSPTTQRLTAVDLLERPLAHALR